MVAPESSEVVSPKLSKELYLELYFWATTFALYRIVFLVFLINRSNRLRCSIKSCCEIFLNIHKKTLVLESLFNKVAGIQVYRPGTLLEKDSNTNSNCFSVYIAKLLRTPNLRNISANDSFFVKVSYLCSTTVISNLIGRKKVGQI